MPEPVIVVDELNTSELAQASANSAVPCRKPTECRCPVGVVHTGAETLDVSTVIDTNGAYDSVRIELQGGGAGFRPRTGALDLLDLSQSFVKPAERIRGAARRVHSADELADARRGAFIESRQLIDAVVRSRLRSPSVGRAQARSGAPAFAGVGAGPERSGVPHPGAVGTPNLRAGLLLPCGVAGDWIRSARQRAATGWQFRRLGAQPSAHPVAGMRVKPAHRLPRRHHQTRPPRDASGGFRTGAPGNRPGGQDRTRCSPRRRRRQAAGRYLLPGGG
jgi:hypothetical protein